MTYDLNNREEARGAAINMAKKLFREVAIVCVIDGNLIVAAHHESRYLTSFSPMSKAESMESCNINIKPLVWMFEPVGAGAAFKDLLSALPRKGE